MLKGLPGGLLATIALAIVLAIFSAINAMMNAGAMIKIYREFNPPVGFYPMFAMPYILIAFAIALITLCFQRRKLAILPSILLASSPSWPFLVQQFSPSTFPSRPIPWQGDGATWMWMVMFGLATAYMVRLAHQGFLR